MARSNQGKTYVQFHREVSNAILEKEKQFTSDNVDKALCATGHKDKETTLKWLLAHSGDPTLNQRFQREYIIFLCPTGPLLSEVSKFYEDSFAKCGGNSAHNLFPHITISSFFKASDSTLPQLLDIIKQTVQTALASQSVRLNLILQRSEGYIGLFLNECATSWIADILSAVVEEALSKLGVHIKVQERQFHLTLAYNFDLAKTAELESLAAKLNLDAPVRWELNVYSRDPRFNGKQFQIVSHDYKVSKSDELDLRQNCHVVMDINQSKHKGWRKGTDFETGRVGFFPESFTKKTAEWRLWTKNLSLPITQTTNERVSSQALEDRTNRRVPRRSQSMNFKKEKKDNPLRSSLRSNSRPHLQSGQDKLGKKNAETWEPVIRASTAINPSVSNHIRHRSADIEQQRPPSGASFRRDDGPADARSRNETERRSLRRMDRENKTQPLTASQLKSDLPATRRIFFMRHAERVDLTFGHDWFHLYIDDRGYHRRNLNLPRRIPTRRGGPKDFFLDGPISEIGTFQARLIGEALRAKGVTFTEVYSSPSLRCIQTATSVLEGLMDTQTRIKLEPALFEWMAWCRNTLPKFMTADELADYGLSIDRNYICHFPFVQFNLHEKTDEYYYRSHSFVEAVSKRSSGNVLMVGHSATLDVCTRQITGNPIRKTDDLVRVVQKVPFCGLCSVEEVGSKSWSLVQPPIPSLAHGQNQAFDWRVLESIAPPGPPYGR